MRGHSKRTAGVAQAAERLSAARGANGATTAQPDVDPEKFRASMERLFEIYQAISSKADDVMKSRCPYKDARSRCTAAFDCRNQFFTKDPSAKPVCAGSDLIDYRPAWITG